MVAGTSSTTFINEFHYDNAGADVGEFIEIVTLAGTDLTGWSIVLYNNAGFLDPNSANRFSVNASDMTVEGVDLRIGRDLVDRNQLAVAKKGPFNLVMRLYTPERSVIDDLSSASLPRIERESCAA